LGVELMLNTFWPFEGLFDFRSYEINS